MRHKLCYAQVDRTEAPLVTVFLVAFIIALMII